MGEARKARVMLLDDRHLDIVIQPKLFASELLDLVTSYFNLRESKYVGLTFKDQSNHYRQWLALDRRVLEQELPKTETLIFYLHIRFYVRCISLLRDSATMELFYAQAQASVATGLLTPSSAVVFQLAALVLQRLYGDYDSGYEGSIPLFAVSSDSESRHCLKKHPLLPVATLKEHPDISYCEDEVIKEYKLLQGLSSGVALVRYMVLVQGLSAYGIHFYEIKDKSSIPWWLGVGYRGITIYDYNDRTKPRKEFPWSSLEHLYFRDKKFSFQIFDVKRTSSRRPFAGGGLVHSWWAATASLTRCIWAMAVDQHQFYLNGVDEGVEGSLCSARSLSDIAAALCCSSSTFSTPSSLTSPPSCDSTLPRSSLLYTGAACGALQGDSPAESFVSGESSYYSARGENEDSVDGGVSGLTAAQLYVADEQALESSRLRQEYTELALRRAQLEAALSDKLTLLRNVCLEESKITGVLPAECPTPDALRAVAERQSFTTKSLLSSPLIASKLQGIWVPESAELRELGEEIERQGSILTAAAAKGALSSRRSFRSKRRSQSFQRAADRLRSLEAQRISVLLSEHHAAQQQQRSSLLRNPSSLSANQSQSSLLSANQDSLSLSSTNQDSLSRSSTNQDSLTRVLASSLANSRASLSPDREIGTCVTISVGESTSSNNDNRVLSHLSSKDSLALVSSNKDVVPSFPSNEGEISAALSTNKEAGAISSSYKEVGVAATLSRDGLQLDLNDRAIEIHSNTRGCEANIPSCVQQQHQSQQQQLNQQQQQMFGSGYIPSSVYSTRTQYRDQTYPTFAHSPHSVSRFAHATPPQSGGGDSKSALTLSLGSSTGTVCLGMSMSSNTGMSSSPVSTCSVLASPCTPMTSRGVVPPAPPQRSYTPGGAFTLGASLGGGGVGDRRRVAVNNLYNTATARSFCYDSADELKTPSPIPLLVHSPYLVAPSDGRAAAGGRFNFAEPPLSKSRSLAGSGQDVRAGNMHTLVGSLEVLAQGLEPHEGSCSPRLGGGEGGGARGAAARVQRYETHVEVSKPFSMADAFKYSERRRKQGGGGAGLTAGGTLDV